MGWQTHSFYKLYNIASSPLQVRQLCHLERFRQTTALCGMGVSNYFMTKNRKYDFKKYDENFDMFIHGVGLLLRSASRRRRRKMQAAYDPQ